MGYAFSTVKDLVGILQGDLDSLAQLPFDVEMLYETGRNAREDYGYGKTNLKEDLAGIKDDFYNAADYLREKVNGK